MNNNVILFHKPQQPRVGILAMPEDETPLGLTIPASLARSIRITAGQHCKDPHEFVLTWLQSGFPEEAA